MEASNTLSLSKEKREHVSKIRKLIFTKDVGTIIQGIEFARSLKEVEIFDYFLEGVSCDEARSEIVPNKRFTGSEITQSYRNFALLRLIAYAPDECAIAVDIRNTVKIKLVNR